MKRRLDVILTEQGIFTSREKAKRAINAGIIYVDGIQANKPSELFDEDAAVEIRGEREKYVGRGGLKLEKALDEFLISVDGLICMDAGASTGGFTDCMLQRGAERVYAVDVGTGQLDETLRTDSRVVVMEKTDIRDVTAEKLGGKIDFIGTDVSFISLELILPALYSVLKDNGTAVALIKPQFEAGKGNIGKNGIVKDKRTHAEVINKIMNVSRLIGFSVLGITSSPIKGGSGNIEYLIYLKKDGLSSAVSTDIKDLVNRSRRELSD